MQATNVGTLPAIDVVIRDDIAVPMPGYLTFVDQSWSLNGSTNGHHGRGLAADRRLLDDLWRPAAGPRGHAALPRRAERESCVGTRVTNTGTVYWNDPAQTASASVSIDVGGIAGHRRSSTAASGTTRTSIACTTRTRSRSRAGTSSSIERLARARRAHGGRRHLPHERRRAELRDDGHLRAAFPPARRRAHARRCSAARIPSSRTICSTSPRSSCCRAAICRT